MNTTMARILFLASAPLDEGEVHINADMAALQDTLRDAGRAVSVTALVAENDPLQRLMARGDRPPFDQKQFSDALADFQQLVKLPSADASTWNGLANTCEELKQYPDAISAYAQAIKCDPQAAYLYRNRANIWLRLGRLDEAELDVAQVTRLEPEHPYTRARQGYLALARGQYAEAASRFELAANTDDRVAWQLGLVLSQLGSGEIDEAQALLTAALPRADADDREEALFWLDRIAQQDASLAPKLEVARARLKG